MRRVLFGFSLLALSSCASTAPDRSYPVFFTPFSSQIDDPGAAIIANAAAIANRYPKSAVEVIGYADPVGTPGDATKISQARADVVSNRLVTDGVAGSRIITRNGGAPPSSQPGVKDRRAEIDIDLP